MRTKSGETHKTGTAGSTVKRGRSLDVFWPMAILIAMAPLPLASDKPWAWNALSLIVGALLLWWGVSVFRASSTIGLSWRQHGLTTLLACLLLAWFAVQTLSSVPSGWQHPLWRDAATTLDTTLAGSISIDPAATGDALTRVLAYVGIFWLVMQVSRHTARARQLLLVVVAAGAVFAAYGMVAEIGGIGRELWSDGATITGSLTGPFLDRNSFAIYLGLCLMAALALLSSRRGADRTAPLRSREGLRQFLASLHPEAFTLMALAAVLATALALTHSGIGFICTVLGFAVFVVARTATRGQRLGRSLTIGLIVAICGVLAIQFLDGAPVSRFAGDDTAVATRADLHGITVDAIADAPIRGHGLGTFPELFQVYRDASFPWLAPAFSRAHGAYLEFASEAGIVATLALLVIGGWLAAACVRGTMHQRRDAVFPALALAASVLVGMQAFVDFGVQMPAVATTFAAILATGFAHAWPTGNEETVASIGRQIHRIEAS